MTLVVWRLFARRSSGAALARPGTPLESMLFGAEVPPGAEVFDGFSYRVSARFAGRCRVVVLGDRLAMCGPRGPRGLYIIWIWLQGALMAAAPATLVWALVALDAWLLLWTLGLIIASTIVMAIGAGVWPGLGEVTGLGDGHMPALEFATSTARDVTLGHGWANGGLALVLFPYVAGIDKLAEDHAVSWWGPDADGREVRFAMHCYRPEDARRLHALLGGTVASART
jgi:hypothetical protein